VGCPNFSEDSFASSFPRLSCRAFISVKFELALFNLNPHFTMAAKEQLSEPLPGPTESQKKRLFVCCDGTWMDAVNSDYPLTNVARLSRCIKAVSVTEDNTQVLQIVYYQTGVGRGTSMVGRAVDGATGRGYYIPVLFRDTGRESREADADVPQVYLQIFEMPIISYVTTSTRAKTRYI
jgi:hypothetical protein